jgi:lysozyme
MITGSEGLSLIKRFEGLYLESYLCPAKVWTIGYGHTKGVVKGQKITEEEAENFLKKDLAVAEKTVNSLNVQLTQNQFDALVSFVFNLGSGNFLSSTLCKKVKKDPNDSTIKNEFGRWVNSKGKKLPGLVKRRQEESELYFS